MSLPSILAGIQNVMGWYAGYVEELQAFPKPMDSEQVGKEGGREGGREGRQREEGRGRKALFEGEAG